MAKTGSTLEEATANAVVDPALATPVSPAAPASTEVALPTMPDDPTDSGADLIHKTTVIYGPAGVGKSTLASQWGDRPFFFNCAGELSGLSVRQLPITNWSEFLAAGASLKKKLADAPEFYTCGVIDTADMLGRYCSEKVRRKLGIVHESDAEWGKGWTMLREELQTALAKLAAIPNFGVVIITHAQDVEIKGRGAVYNKMVPSLNKGIREACVNMADLVLYVDFVETEADEPEERVIHTKPSKFWDAKERGTHVRLPAEIRWPVNTNGFELIRTAWEGGN